MQIVLFRLPRTRPSACCFIDARDRGNVVASPMRQRRPASRAGFGVPTRINGARMRNGVADGTRTHDNRNHNPGLYQLGYWAPILEMDNRYLRAVLLPDGETVQNAFFDRWFQA